MSSFELNDSVRVRTTFTNTSGTVGDPTAVYFKFKNPKDEETVYQYGVDAELEKEATGIYYVDVDADAPGVWKYKFYSTGSLKGADAGSFTVENNY